MNARRSPRRRRLAATALALFGLAFGPLAVVAAVAPDATAAGSRGALAAYDVFTGSVADFYVVPTPLPAGAPGELIRVQDVATTATSVTKRIMYHSVDGAGRDRAVTGTITYPTAPPPPGGWPVVSIANGTIGLGSQCAISRTNNAVPTFGLEAVGVESDYVGSGPVGESQAYLSRASEGHSVLDAVRAARNLTAANAGSDVVVLGSSQGGHGALSANELAAGYAPELSLLGTVAGAPAAMFDRTYGPLDEIVSRVVGAMGFAGLSTEHPEIVWSDYLTPAGITAMTQITSQCRDETILTVLGVPFDGFYTHDPVLTEPARSIMLANDVGNVRADSPVLLVQGTADTTVFPARTHDLLARMCAVGQVVRYDEVAGADHGNVFTMDLANIESWLADRFAQVPPPNSCDQAPVTTSTTVSPTTEAPGTSQPAPPTSAAVAAAGTTPPTGPTGNLARTGSPLTPVALAGVGLVMIGVILAARSRRRLS